MNEIQVYEQTQALAEAHRMNYTLTVPTNGRQIELVRGVDFDKIPKTKKPTLTKAGCLRIAKEGYGLCVEPIIEQAIEQTDPFPFFFYRARVNLYTFTKDGQKVIVSSGVGSANSSESRNGNNSAYNSANTALKFAEKRATSDAVINLTGLSNIFVQDMDNEDFTESGFYAMKQTASDNAPITPKQVKRLYAIGAEAGKNVEEIRTLLTAKGYASTKDITQAQYDEVCKLVGEAK